MSALLRLPGWRGCSWTWPLQTEDGYLEGREGEPHVSTEQRAAGSQGQMPSWSFPRVSTAVPWRAVY